MARLEGDLRQKYLELARKYAALVARSDQDRPPTGSRVGGAPGRLGTVAVALVRDGKLVHPSVHWPEVVPSGFGRKLPALVRLMRREGARVEELRVAGRAGATLSVRIESLDGGAVVLAAEAAETWPGEKGMRERLVVNDRLRTLGQLAAAVAHDLGSTLRSARYLISSMESDAVLQARVHQTLALLGRAVDDSSQVVARLHDFAQSGGLVLQPCDLGAVIEQAMRLFELDSQTGKQRRRVERHIGKLPLVRAAPGELAHVLLNLLRNARDATPADGRIALFARLQRGRVRISLSDDGSGIPQKNLARIFEPFFSTKGAAHSGLGLFIASGLLQDMEGSIRAANRKSGGATFTLDLPVATFVASRRGALPAPARPAARRSRRARRGARRSSSA